MSSNTHSPCAACKFLRRKCTQECVFAPYFPPDQPQKFANVHRVYGASNVAKILNELNTVNREDAVTSLAYEAEARLRDPVYGCVGFISILQNRLKQVQTDLYNAKKDLSTYVGPQTVMIPVFHQPQQDINATSMPMLGVSSGQRQLVIHQPHQQQQQQLFEIEAHQQELVRFDINGLDAVAASSVTGNGFHNPMPNSGGGAGGVTGVVPAGGISLGLGGSFDNPYGHHIQEQAAHNSIDFRLQAQLMQLQHRSDGEES